MTVEPDRAELLRSLRAVHDDLERLGVAPLVSMAAARTYDDSGLKQVLMVTHKQLLDLVSVIEEL